MLMDNALKGLVVQISTLGKWRGHCAKRFLFFCAALAASPRRGFARCAVGAGFIRYSCAGLARLGCGLALHAQGLRGWARAQGYVMEGFGGVAMLDGFMRAAYHRGHENPKQNLGGVGLGRVRGGRGRGWKTCRGLVGMLDGAARRAALHQGKGR